MSDHGERLGIGAEITDQGARFSRNGLEIDEPTAIQALIAEYNTTRLPEELKNSKPQSAPLLTPEISRAQTVLFCPNADSMGKVLEIMWQGGRDAAVRIAERANLGPGESSELKERILWDLKQRGRSGHYWDSGELFHPFQNLSLDVCQLENGAIGLKIDGNAYRSVSRRDLTALAALSGSELMTDKVTINVELGSLDNRWVGVSPAAILHGLGVEREDLQAQLFSEFGRTGNPISVEIGINGVTVSLEIKARNTSSWDKEPLTRLVTTPGIVYFRHPEGVELEPQLKIEIAPTLAKENWHKIPSKEQSDEVERIAGVIGANLSL